MNKKNIIITLLVVIIIFLISIIVLFATNRINSNTNNNANNNNNNDDISTITNDEALAILKNSYNSTVRHIFNQVVSYCGDYAKGENTTLSLNGFSYTKSATFNSFKELDSHVKKYLTENLLSNTNYNRTTTINNTKIVSYYEKDGNLYCNGWNKGGNIELANYSQEESNFKITTIDKDTFSAEIDAVYYDINNEQKTIIKIKLTFIKENENWLIDSYEKIN